MVCHLRRMDQDPYDPLPLSDRVVGRRASMRDTVASAFGVERRLASSAFAPLNTKRLLSEGIEGGAFAIYPLALAHGWFAVSGLVSKDMDAFLQHACLTLLAISAYYAARDGRTAWPSILILSWLLTEIFLGRLLFDYPAGGSILNWIAVPLAILGVRAAWRRRASDRRV